MTSSFRNLRYPWLFATLFLVIPAGGYVVLCIFFPWAMMIATSFAMMLLVLFLLLTMDRHRDEFRGGFSGAWALLGTQTISAAMFVVGMLQFDFVPVGGVIYGASIWWGIIWLVLVGNLIFAWPRVERAADADAMSAMSP